LAHLLDFEALCTNLPRTIKQNPRQLTTHHTSITTQSTLHLLSFITVSHRPSVPIKLTRTTENHKTFWLHDWGHLYPEGELLSRMDGLFRTT